MTAGTSPPVPIAVAEGRVALRWVIFAVVLAANVMDLMDATIVNVAGPSIRSALGGSPSTLQWLPAGYTLALAVLLITSGRLGDMFGRRRMFLVGSAGFTFFSAACAAAPSMGVLIGLRVLQGAFGAMMIPQGFGMLKESFAEDEMAKVFGAFGPTMGLSMLAAPILAGGLIEANLWGTGWRLLFLINVPIGVATFAGGVRVLPRTVTHPGIGLDVLGTALVGMALTALIYPLIEGRSDGWPAWTFVMLAAGVVLLGGFVLSGRRRGIDPLIQPSLLTNRSYTSGVLVALAFFGTFAGLLLCVSVFVQLGEGFSPIRAGLTLLPMVVGMIAGMAGGLALVKPLGRRVLHLGIAVVAAGTVTLAVTMSGLHHASIRDLAPALVLIGLGFGGSTGQLFEFLLAGVSMDEVGSASGVLEAVQQFSSAAGVAALGTVFFGAYAHHVPTHALALTAWACLVPIAATFGLVFMLPERPLESTVT
ncbi:MFS transporter [Acidiferrimicrobium sp. IK]|uniref:MFS transporter n=1 Tax=Acidiferrimicrobium sp. IK TaxID=2871700 RepID=UPI0021CB35CF|nr:MFS transporter [Acidiferrimicrobium sp. IK]MCU4185799.1 MFS transporter [Acidiferrimicrobium sp. IK]